MGKKWSEERKAKASEAIKARNEASKNVSAKERTRIPLGQKRDVLNVQATPEGSVDRIVNDKPGRIASLQQRGYELVEEAQLGTAHVDGNQAKQGVVSRDVGKGQTAYVMRQRQDWYDEDQATKQRQIDERENDMRGKVKPQDSTDGTYGEVKIN